MSASHTPGPWDLDAGFLVTRAFVNGVGIPLLQFEGRAEEAGEGFGWVTGGPAEHRANERLIAAAPDLLAALEAVLDSSGARGEYHSLKYSDAVESAEAAIAKAKGSPA